MSDDRNDRVRRRAYELWEQQGSEHGRHEDHWHRASAEIDADGDESPAAGTAPQEDETQAVVTAPDGTTLTVPEETIEGPAAAEAKPTRRRAARTPAASSAIDKAPAKPRKPKTR